MAVYDFTGANGDPLPSGLTEYNGTGEIQNDAAVATGADPLGVKWLFGAESQADGSFIAHVNCNGSSVSATTGSYCRATNNDNLIMSVLNPVDGLLKLFKRVGGVFTALGVNYTVPSFSNTQTYKVEIVANDDQLSVKLDDVTVISPVTEAFNKTATQAGIRFGTTAHFVDSLTIPDAVSTDSLTLTTNDYTITQRDISGNGTLTFDMDWVGSPAEIEYSVDGGAYVTGDASPVGGTSSIDILLDDSEHTITFRFSNDIGVNDTITFAAVGDVFATLGQSNPSGRLANNQTFTPNVGGASAHLYGNDNNFKVLADPYDSNVNQVDQITNDASAAGAWAVRFANAYLENNNVPVGLIPNCIGATEIAKFLKDSTDRLGGLNIYESMSKRINAVGGCKAVLFDQYERDCTIGTTQTEYEAALNQLVDDIFADFGVKTIIRSGQIITTAGYDGNGTTTGQIPLRAAQQNVANSNPNAYITVDNTDIDLSGGDGIHFKTDTDGELIGQRVYAAFNNSLGSTLTLTITGIPDGAYITRIQDEDADIQIFNQLSTFSSGASSEILSVVAGTNTTYLVMNDPDNVTQYGLGKGVTL